MAKILTHSLECGHTLEEPQGNSASMRQNHFCLPCKAHVSVIRTKVTETETKPEPEAVVEEVKPAESEPSLHEGLDIEETPEIHETELDEEDLPL